MVKKSPIGSLLRQSNAPDWMKDAGGRITSATAKTLKSLGLPIPSWVKIVDLAPGEAEKAIYVCRAIEADHPETLPDNLVGACAWCGTRIEYRPYAPEGVQKVCMPCAQAHVTSPKN